MNSDGRGGFPMNKSLDATALAVAVIGAVNWGLIGFFNFNLVQLIFGSGLLAKIIYAIVGLCGLYLLTFYGRIGERTSESGV